MAAGEPLPGFGGPSADFGDPFGMLLACHERIERTLRLLDRLCEHVLTAGNDAAAQAAARDVLRYFDVAAPHHHEDEERHVFPAVQALGDAALHAAVARLQADHAAMAARWARTRQALLALADARVAALSPGQRGDIAAFAAGYAAHIRTEEDLVYPAARAAMAAAAVQAMGQEMRRRRGGTD